MSALLVIDFAGHGFQMDLSRALARRGHVVTHSYCSTNLTPHGNLTSGPGLEVVPVGTGGTFEKYRLGGRLRSEVVYGVRSARLVLRSRPNGVLTSNVPLISLLLIALAARARRSRWVMWLQDVQTGLAMQSLSGVGRAASWVLGALERWLIRSADQVVVISDDFVPAVRHAGADDPTIIENWAVLDELAVLPKANEWSIEHKIDSKSPVFLYGGTLGRKHPPGLLVALAEELGDRGQLVVASEGEGAETLRRDVKSRDLDNVVLLPFQSHERLAEMLSSADVLVAVLDETASSFSVPSKVLSYLCARRALLVAMPPENGASRLVNDVGAGIVVSPTADGIRKGAAQLLAEPEAWPSYGSNGRRYAESAFDVDAKAIQFEKLLEGSTTHMKEAL